MKALAALALLLALVANSDDVVDTAKDAKAKRKKSTTKVITNADVKKSKGKIVTTSVPHTTPEKVPSLSDQAEAKRAAENRAAELRAAHDKLVADLEKQLEVLEQQYYDETDLAKRDTEIVKKFNDVKAKLDAAHASAPPKP